MVVEVIQYTPFLNDNYQCNRLHEADVKYENREPREIDLRKISELEGTILDREKDIQKLQSELQYYRLEMNNREMSFNRIFNKSPLVGLVSPVHTNIMKTKGGAPRRNSNPKLPPLNQTAIDAAP